MAQIWSTGHVCMEHDQIYVIRSLWPRYFEIKGHLDLQLQINTTQLCFGLQCWYCWILLSMSGDFHLCCKFDLKPRSKVKVTHIPILPVNAIKSEIWGLGSPNLHKLSIYGGARMSSILSDLDPFSRSNLAIFQNGRNANFEILHAEGYLWHRYDLLDMFVWKLIKFM